MEREYGAKLISEADTLLIEDISANLSWRRMKNVMFFFLYDKICIKKDACR